MFKNWKQQFDPQFWRADYSYIQRSIPTIAAVGLILSVAAYFLDEFAFGSNKSLPFRLVIWLMIFSFLFYPKKSPLSAFQKVYWEFVVYFVCVTFSAYEFLYNDANRFWSVKFLFFAMLCGILARPVVFPVFYPISVSLSVLLFHIFHSLNSHQFFESLWTFTWASFAAVFASCLRIHSENLYHEVQNTNRQLKEWDKQKTQFFQNISHEFRTPLTLILGPLDEIACGQFGPISEGLCKQVEGMRRNAHRLLHLINQLLDLARIEAKQMTLQTERIDVVPFVREVVATFESLAKRKETQLEFLSDAEKIEACLDRDKIEAVLVNLLSNAFKFTDSGGRIRCTLRAMDDALELTVQDTGGGIPPDQLPHVFDRFRQVDSSTTRKHEGTGIGLALVREFVELHQGQVTVTSEVGFGTKFQINLPKHLPVTISEADQEREVVSPKRKAQPLALVDSLTQGPSHQSGNGVAGKLLVVEDNKDMQSFICHCLKGHGFQIHVAGNGKEGLEIARSERPDLILSDVMMPEMDGYQLLQAIREDRETQHIPVVMLTARASQELKVEGLEAGAMDFLSKPFDRNEIVARVVNLMKLKRMSQQVDTLNRELAESTLKRYLPPGLVEKIIAGELQFDEEPRSITATILFSDLAGFTALSANLRAARTARLLNEYLTAMNEVIFKHCGTVDKFIGDGIMVIFGAPHDMSIEEQSRKATACAVHMQAKLEELNEEWTKTGLPALCMRIGLHQGPVVVGNFGSDKRVEYTAIGSTVNLASRIESVCEPGRVYLSGEVCDSLLETEFEDAGSFKLKGVPGEVRLFRLVGSCTAQIEKQGFV